MEHSGGDAEIDGEHGGHDHEHGERRPAHVLGTVDERGGNGSRRARAGEREQHEEHDARDDEGDPADEHGDRRGGDRERAAREAHDGCARTAQLGELSTDERCGGADERELDDPRAAGIDPHEPDDRVRVRGVGGRAGVDHAGHEPPGERGEREQRDAVAHEGGTRPAQERGGIHGSLQRAIAARTPAASWAIAMSGSSMGVALRPNQIALHPTPRAPTTSAAHESPM